MAKTRSLRGDYGKKVGRPEFYGEIKDVTNAPERLISESVKMMNN